MQKTLFAIGTLIIMGGIYWWTNPQDAALNAERDAIPAIAQRVYQATLFNNVEAIGTTYANESVNISSNVAEKITELSFKEGEPVKQGQIIAKLAQTEEAATLEAKHEQLKEHQRELERLSHLVDNRAATQRNFDERKTMLSVTEIEIKQIEAQIEDRTIRAPFDGVIGMRRVSVGSLVEPGTKLTTIDDIAKIKLEFSVPSIYLDDITIGTIIQAETPAFKHQSFTGTIDVINTRIDPITRAVTVRAIINNPSHQLKPGLLMNVNVISQQRDALVIAEQAIIQQERNHIVFVVNPENHTVRKQIITIGIRQKGLVEIIDGLQPGDLVLLTGLDYVKPNTPVKLTKILETIDNPQQILEAI